MTGSSFSVTGSACSASPSGFLSELMPPTMNVDASIGLAISLIGLMVAWYPGRCTPRRAGGRLLRTRRLRRKPMQVAREQAHLSDVLRLDQARCPPLEADRESAVGRH